MLLREITGAFNGGSNSRLTDYESDALPTASRRLMCVFVSYVDLFAMLVWSYVGLVLC